MNGICEICGDYSDIHEHNNSMVCQICFEEHDRDRKEEGF